MVLEANFDKIQIDGSRRLMNTGVARCSVRTVKYDIESPYLVRAQ